MKKNEKEKKKEKAKVVIIMNRKGGCGKTTTCKNIAYNLAALNDKKVLLVDFDPQMNATKGLTSRSFKKTVIGLLKNETVQKCIYHTRFSNLDLIAGNDFLASEDIKDDVVKDQLEQIKELYDYIIIDTSPYFNKLTAELVLSHDLMIIPTEINDDSIGGLQTTINELKALCPQNQMNFRILYSKVDETKETQKDLKELQHAFKKVSFQTYIRYNYVPVRRARKNRIPLSKRYPTAKVTQDYEDLAKELMEVI